MFSKILIANRGDIALRILRACKELEIKTVAVHSTADNEAMHVRLADESVCIGPAHSSKSYLNIPSIITAAQLVGADAIHPGVGFLSENSSFAEIVKAHDIKFIGPKIKHLKDMGDKIKAKEIAKKIGLPLVPGSKGVVKDIQNAKKEIQRIGLPILIKASAGGGGKGMKIVQSIDEIEIAFTSAKNEARAAFGNDEVYIEKYLSNPRHIEVQIIGDTFGNVFHLGERECSIQRNHQKLIEEAPSPALTKDEREYICNLSASAARDMQYESLGTIEFLYEDGKFYFIEMNTRLQVEHPITEAITGKDIVKEQIKIAANHKLEWKQKDIKFFGHAIECRINAEDPKTFMPSPGKINQFHSAGGLGIRIDSGIYSGYNIPPYYDSLIAKLIAHGNNRKDCILKLKQAIKEMVIEPIPSTLELHENLLENPDIINGNFDIKWLEQTYLNGK
ncbi:MAG: acetyl-CoA carboxylase biotin carboxylase subunit [SAR116 cluster bacterium]|nr:acetyl-CoA carboxylase biotin carboxylase subunit [SAR116 cluster bacterium]RPH10797.1 MAG: acetyl-CoA carboxylase biotin carboxylase subunit [Alphaproteobacteria bacterium TMED54]